MSKIKIIVSLTVFSLLITACSKDKSLERKLYKKEGMWKIVTYFLKKTVNGAVIEEYNFSNAGSVEFDDDGTGERKISYAGYKEESDFLWEVKSEKLLVTQNGSIDEFKITKESKKDFNFDRNATVTENGSAVVVIEKYALQRIK
jgi:hypothetical protein